MSGYEGTHQDWLEGQASDQLERERFEREYRALPLRFDVAGDGWHLICGGSGVKRIWTAEVEWLTDEQMVRLANAILSEVEIAQRGDTE